MRRGIGDVAVTAVGIDDQGAVGAGHAGAADIAGDFGTSGIAGLQAGDGGGIGALGIGGGIGASDQVALDAGVILADGARVGHGSRRGVGDQDIQGRVVDLGVALRVGDDHGEAVDDVASGMVGAGPGRVVAVADHAGGGIEAGDGEGAVAAWDGDVAGGRVGQVSGADHGAAKGQAGQAIRRTDGEAAGGGAIFRDVKVGSGNAGVIVRDGNGRYALTGPSVIESALLPCNIINSFKCSIQSGSLKANGRIQLPAHGVQHHKTMAATCATTRAAAGAWARSGGLKVGGGVKAGGQGLFKVGIDSGFAGVLVRCRRLPAAALSNINNLARSQLQGDFAAQAGHDLFAAEQAFAFEDLTLEAVEGDGEDLAYKILNDGGDVAHRYDSMYSDLGYGQGE